jgi:hypothetical protein
MFISILRNQPHIFTFRNGVVGIVLVALTPAKRQSSELPRLRRRVAP